MQYELRNTIYGNTVYAPSKEAMDHFLQSCKEVQDAKTGKMRKHWEFTGKTVADPVETGTVQGYTIEQLEDMLKAAKQAQTPVDEVEASKPTGTTPTGTKRGKKSEE